MNGIRGNFGIVCAPVDEVHAQTANYRSLPSKDVDARFYVQEYPALVSVREGPVHSGGSLHSLLESIVRPVQNVANRVLRER